MKTETMISGNEMLSVNKNSHEVTLKQNPADLMETLDPDYLTTPSAVKLMPTDLDDKSLLRLRSLELAKERKEDNQSEKEQFLCFRLGPSEWYGIPYRWLDELIYATGLVPVPGTPPFIAGVVNHQAGLLTVLDLKHFFRTKTTESEGQNWIAVVQVDTMRLGVLMDEVSGNDLYEPASLLPALSSDGAINLSYVLGIYKGTVTMLDFEALLSSGELIINDERP